MPGSPGYQLPTKEVAMQMANPDTGTERAVKRLARYLRLVPDLRLHYRWLRDPGTVTVSSDSGLGAERHEDPHAEVHRCTANTC